MLDCEDRAKREGFLYIVGVDEAGRGPLAGPVVASAVLVHTPQFSTPIKDSKKLSPKQREIAFHQIYQNAYIGIGIMSETVIDEVNILQATFLAMRNAVDDLISRLPDVLKSEKDFQKKVCLLVDGNMFKVDLPYAYKTIIDGDAFVQPISCASIIAKVTRDRILEKYDQIFPEYGFRKHKGYPTLAHKLAIKRFGLSIIHRKTFQCA